MPDKAETKIAAIRRLTARRNGASVEELMSETGWQKHSLHGQLATMRKKGAAITRAERKNGTFAYFLKG